VPDLPSNSGPNSRTRGATIIAAGLLLAALAVVVLYTNRGAFLSPVAMVVIAAIGLAALLLQTHLRSDVPLSMRSSSLRPLWLNLLGVVCAIAAVFADVLRLGTTFMMIAALAAVVAFAISGLITLNTLRKTKS
jgi:hypothetical protein